MSLLDRKRLLEERNFTHKNFRWFAECTVSDFILYIYLQTLVELILIVDAV